MGTSLYSHNSYWSAGDLGFPVNRPLAAGDFPPGDGGYSVPHQLSFSGLVTNASKSYLYQFDEALRNSPQNALAMRRDPVLWWALRSRQRPTAQLSWNITARDETDPAQTEAAKLVTEIVEDIPHFQKMKMELLEALWFGKYGVEVAYEWKRRSGHTCLEPRDFIPINGDKLRFKWDGTPGVLVYGNFPGTWEATDWGPAHFMTPQERQQYILHIHEPDDADWTEPEMGGSVFGYGLRGRLYWFWWLKQQVMGMLMNYLQRFSNGLTIFYYQAGNPQSEQAAQQAAAAQFSTTALLYPRWPSERPDVNGVQRMEVGTASQALMEKLVTDYFDRIMIQAILGQTLSSGTASTGLGSGVANLHSDTLDEIVKYDAVDFGETLQSDLVNVIYRWTCPGIRPGKFSFEIDSPNSQELMDYAQLLVSWGVPLDEEQVYKISQWSKPKPGSGIVGGMQPMQPSMTGQPTGVPAVGASPSSGQPVPMSRWKARQLKRRRVQFADRGYGPPA